MIFDGSSVFFPFLLIPLWSPSLLSSFLADGLLIVIVRVEVGGGVSELDLLDPDLDLDLLLSDDLLSDVLLSDDLLLSEVLLSDVDLDRPDLEEPSDTDLTVLFLSNVTVEASSGTIVPAGTLPFSSLCTNLHFSAPSLQFSPYLHRTFFFFFRFESFLTWLGFC